ncbi:hypothetical protein ARMSODRAFT_899407, partial [Armillaria solidipes]
CLVTIFACTWFAIHPNVPGRNITTKGTISCIIQHARLMIMAILAPEIIVGWAATQFMVKADTRSWIFPQHGGNLLYPNAAISPYRLVKSYQESGHSTPIQLLVETIEDKSKGNVFSKMISIFQISWFIVKGILRTVQRLPLTLLEMSTLTFASLSIITYFLWWHKPLNVRHHISLDGLDLSEFMRTLAMKSCKQSASPTVSSDNGVTDALPWVSTVVAKFLLLGPADGHDNIGDGALPLDVGNSKSMAMPLVVVVFVGSLFGAFYFTTWSFYFPSHTEMVLWRFSSVAVMIGFLAVAILTFIEELRPKWTSKLPRPLRSWLMDPSICQTILKPCLFSLAVVGILTFIVGQIILIILAFTQLRSLPQLAFQRVKWTFYIPHI